MKITEVRARVVEWRGKTVPLPPHFCTNPMDAVSPMLTKATMVDGRLETGILPTGQGVGAIDELLSVADLVARIVDEAEQTLTRLEKGGA